MPLVPTPLASPPLEGGRATPADEVRGAGPEIVELFEAHRRELTGYCYRMLGASSEAEDAVQEALLRAYRGYGRFEGRSSLRSWLYRIAHHICVDMVRSPQRRARPMELGPSSQTAHVVLGDPLVESTFVQPIADVAVLDLDRDPAELVEERETIRLAFVAALQHLPARQRSVLILRDVLRLRAAEVAELLDTSVAGVNSALQRARATLEQLQLDKLDPILDEDHEELLSRYVDAFERYDIDALVRLLRDDVVLSMPPFDFWFRGPDELAAWFSGPGIGCEGSKLVPVTLNGTAGFVSYRVAGPGRWEPWALQVIEVSGGLISGHHNFLFPERRELERLGLPLVIEG